MQLDNLIIEKVKILNYLLNLSHPDSSAKARFFLNQGFKSENWSDFALALKKHAIFGKVVNQEQTNFGSKIVIEGVLETPLNKMPLIRSVWFLEKQEKYYKLVTAYPVKK